MKKEQFTISGMHCVSCASVIEKKVSGLEGVDHCAVNYTQESADISYDPAKVAPEKIAAMVDDLWYTLHTNTSHVMADGTVMEGDDHSMHTGVWLSQEEKVKQIRAMQWKVYTTLPLVVISFVYMWWDIMMMQWWWWVTMPSWLSSFFHHLFPVMATYVLFTVGTAYLKGIWTFLKHRVATMDTLIGIGTLTAYLYSFAVWAFESWLENYVDVSVHYWDVTIVVIGLVYLGKYLEEKSKLHTGDAITKLLGLQAKTALVLEDGEEKEMSIDALVLWQTVVVKPGMTIPVDGKIVHGQTSIDESMISGESLPIDKKEWDTVVWGTVNIQWYIHIETKALWSETVLSRIVTMVQNAQASKAPIQHLVDKISAVFVPVVLLIALGAFIFWLVFGSLPIALMTGIGVLVIACPCALGLATPMGVIVGVGKWAERGILIKNAESLQKLKNVWVVVFDKTGTITHGKPSVVNMWWDTQYLSIVHAIENQSEHPLAQSIVSSTADHKADVDLRDFAALGGKGVRATVDKKDWYIGNEMLMREQGIEKFPEVYEAWSKEWKTVVFAAVDGVIQLSFAIADTIKEEAKDAIAHLHRMGITSVMITGDHADVAHYVANQVGIDQVFAGVLPEDKAGHIVSLQQSSGKKVAMAWDGINDAPALAQADVGIAMSTGTDVAIETADITLLHGDISKIAQAIRLSQQTMRTIKQNLFWAFIYNAIGIPLAAGLFYPILLNPVFAGAAMAFSSVSVVLNSLRLKVTKL